MLYFSLSATLAVEAEQGPADHVFLASSGEACHGLSNGLGPCEGVIF